MFSKDFRDFISLLNKHKVEFIVVGGLAVQHHGYPRFTGDMDIWIRKSEENAIKCVTVLAEFGFASLGFTKEDFLKKDFINQIGSPPLRIDLLSDIDGLTFDECYTNKVQIDRDNLSVPFLSYNDLLKNKKAAGRLKDLADISELEKIKKKRQE